MSKNLAHAVASFTTAGRSAVIPAAGMQPGCSAEVLQRASLACCDCPLHAPRPSSRQQGSPCSNLASAWHPSPTSQQIHTLPPRFPATLVAVVVGKDAVCRATVGNLARLMDEMVTALARCRQPKLAVSRRLQPGLWTGLGWGTMLSD